MVQCLHVEFRWGNIWMWKRWRSSNQGSNVFFERLWVVRDRSNDAVFLCSQKELNDVLFALFGKLLTFTFKGVWLFIWPTLYMFLCFLNWLLKVFGRTEPQYKDISLIFADVTFRWCYNHRTKFQDVRFLPKLFRNLLFFGIFPDFFRVRIFPSLLRPRLLWIFLALRNLVARRRQCPFLQAFFSFLCSHSDPSKKHQCFACFLLFFA